MINEIPAVMNSTQKFARMISEIMQEARVEGFNNAFVLLRACLITLRDRITPGEAVHLGGQLTPVLRGFYYEDWDPTHRKIKFKTHGAFLHEIRDILRAHSDIDVDYAVPVTLKIILRHIDEGEADDVIHCLPKEIQKLCS